MKTKLEPRSLTGSGCPAISDGGDHEGEAFATAGACAAVGRDAERSTALDDDDDQSAAGSNRIELPAAPLQRLPFMIPGRRAWSSKCARPSALST